MKSADDIETDRPATNRDIREAIREMREFVLDRENALIWKVILLQVTLIGAIAGAQWAAVTFTLLHWKP